MLTIDPSRIVTGLIGYFANAFDGHVAQHASSAQHPTTKLLARLELFRRRPLLLVASVALAGCTATDPGSFGQCVADCGNYTNDSTHEACIADCSDTHRPAGANPGEH